MRRAKSKEFTVQGVTVICWKRINIWLGNSHAHLFWLRNDFMGISFERLTVGPKAFFSVTEINANIITIKCDNLSYFVSLSISSRLTDSVCLVCYVSNGHLMAFSLPSLRLLLDVDFLPLADLRWVLIQFICFDPDIIDRFSYNHWAVITIIILHYQNMFS